MRFILALIIVYCHYFSYELQKTNLFTDVEMVNRIHPKVSNAFLVVEMFFIISGFFLYKTYKNHKDFVAFVKSKITRLWPGLFISTISLILLGWTSPIFQTNKYSELLNLLFCQTNGLSLDCHFVNWYISSLFWCLLMDKGIISRLLSLNFLSSAGKYSYTIYVLHEPITWGLITPFLWTPLAAICHTHPAAMLILIPISIVILISALVYKFLETHLKSFLKQRFEDIKWLV